MFSVKKSVKTLALLSILLLYGCANSPDKMESSYVSPIAYQGFNCRQLSQEAASLERRLSTLHGILKKEADTDAWQMGVGLILFWPTLFALEGGDSPRASEYMRLKGEYEAVGDVIREKECDKSP